MTRLRSIVLALTCAVCLGACQQTGTAPPMGQDADGMTPVGSAHGP
ncbi:hypothetical protein [Lichenicola sp.]